MSLSELILEENIVFSKKDSVKEVISELTKTAHSLRKIGNEKEFYNAVTERENIVSTGIGLGIAIPHSKLDSIGDFFIIVGILKNEIEWKSIDSKPVKAVFLIGGPTASQKKYLQILSKIMLLIRSSEIRNRLFNAKESTDITELFSNF